MLVLITGLALVGFGVAGLRYAPAIVAAQHRQGMAPLEGDEIDETDRIRATKWVGAVFVIGGLALLGYGIGVV